MILHYWLICVSFFVPAVLSVMSVYEDGVEVLKIVVYSLISIFSTLLNFMFRPDKHAYGYRIAFELLDAKLNYVEDMPEDKGKKILNDALETGERYITHSLYYTFDKNKEHTHDCCK